jgi:hypothetical protein
VGLNLKPDPREVNCPLQPPSGATIKSRAQAGGQNLGKDQAPEGAKEK